MSVCVGGGRGVIFEGKKIVFANGMKILLTFVVQ